MDIEDLDEMGDDDFLTSGEEESGDDDLYTAMREEDMLGRESLPKKSQDVESKKKAKDVGKLLKAVRMIRKADQLRARGMMVVEEIVGKYPDLAGLAEIVQPTKIVSDQIKVGQPGTSKTPTTVDLSGKKVYPTSVINTLGIRIFSCPVCAAKFRNHGTADAHIHQEHTKIKYGPCPTCNFTTWNGDSYRKHTKKHNKIPPQV